MAGDRAALLEGVYRLAERASEAILQIYRQDFEVHRKADESPVTEADEAAERLIVPGLAALTPDIPVVAEEAVSAGQVPEVSGGLFWLVDPLDGTREFVGRNGEFTVNIALIEAGAPVLGVVQAPALRLCYGGLVGQGAWRRREGGTAQAIEARREPAEGAVVVASRSHLTPETEAWLREKRVQRFSQAGSSLKFCLLAAGEADLYPRHGRTMEWDTAAGHAVLLAAGGSVETLAGAPLRYGKPGFENPHFVAYGRR